MPTTDLSIEALLVRREIAEKATPGPWGVKCERHDNTCHEYLILTEDGDKIVGADKIDLREVYYRSLPEAICSLDSHDAAHIAANSPDVVIATIDELLRLRAECARMEREANWLAGYLTIGAHESYDAARRRWRDAARKAVEEA